MEEKRRARRRVWDWDGTFAAGEAPTAAPMQAEFKLGEAWIPRIYRHKITAMFSRQEEKASCMIFEADIQPVRGSHFHISQGVFQRNFQGCLVRQTAQNSRQLMLVWQHWNQVWFSAFIEGCLTNLQEQRVRPVAWISRHLMLYCVLKIWAVEYRLAQNLRKKRTDWGTHSKAEFARLWHIFQGR